MSGPSHTNTSHTAANQIPSRAEVSQMNFHSYAEVQQILISWGIRGETLSLGHGSLTFYSLPEVPLICSGPGGIRIAFTLEGLDLIDQMRSGSFVPQPPVPLAVDTDCKLPTSASSSVDVVGANIESILSFINSHYWTSTPKYDPHRKREHILSDIRHRNLGRLEATIASIVDPYDGSMPQWPEPMREAAKRAAEVLLSMVLGGEQLDWEALEAKLAQFLGSR